MDEDIVLPVDQALLTLGRYGLLAQKTQGIAQIAQVGWGNGSSLIEKKLVVLGGPAAGQ